MLDSCQYCYTVCYGPAHWIHIHGVVECAKQTEATDCCKSKRKCTVNGNSDVCLAKMKEHKKNRFPLRWCISRVNGALLRRVKQCIYWMYCFTLHREKDFSGSRGNYAHWCNFTVTWHLIHKHKDWKADPKNTWQRQNTVYWGDSIHQQFYVQSEPLLLRRPQLFYWIVILIRCCNIQSVSSYQY